MSAPHEKSGSSPVIRLLARWRVTLGFIAAGVVLWLAEPTPDSLYAGSMLASLGEMIRIWAAGHVEKSREVTRSGPYQFTRHPLYLGSSIIAAGIAIACARIEVAALIVLYVGATITAAIRAEEAHLREKFGREYDDYVSKVAAPMRRSFSFRRAIANREHHTVAGLVITLVLLALKVSD